MNPTLRLFHQLLFAGALVVSTGCGLDAQNTGGPSVANGGNQRSKSSKPRTEFNSLPFRADKNQNDPSSTDVASRQPNRLTTAGQPNQSPSTRQTTLRPMIAQVPAVQGNSNQFGSSNPNQVPTTPASFGNSTNKTQPQLSSQESQSDQPSEDFVDLDICTVNFIDVIMLPAKESGVIQTVSVKEGDFVPAGTVVGKIDDELFQRALEQATLRYELATEAADNKIEILAAEKKRIVATIEARKTSDLADKRSKSETDRLMANYTMEIAALDRDTAIREQQKAAIEQRLEAARVLEVETHIERHVLHSDYDGYVIKILKKPQEYVQQGEEVMQIARMDRLWVQGTIDIARLNPDEVLHRPVTVTVARARGKQTTFEGKITSVGLERQGLTRYLVKAEVQNRPVGNHWVLQPMSTVEMRIHLDGVPKQDGSFHSTATRK